MSAPAGPGPIRLGPMTKASTADQRRGEVLRAIVADFISTQEPVGSKALVERHSLGVSSATVRNDMAVLESEGFITQQHASSGRIPTEKAYRVFVDGIHRIKPLSAPERRAILRFLEEGVDMADVLRRSVQLLAQLTRQVAVAQLPDLRRGRVKHCEVVKLAPSRLLLVLITDTGQVDQRNVDLTAPLPDDDVPRLRDLINSTLVGHTLDDASAEIAAMASGEDLRVPPELKDAALACATVLVETMLERSNDRLMIAGTPNIVRVGELEGVLDALEEQVVVLRLLSGVRDLGVSVTIGEENTPAELQSATVVSTGYGSRDEILGGMGVLGPTYLDYPGTISSVHAVAHYVSRILAGE
ncbi:Heat-inducible transcription repressor HrcA [Corynebacterium provencense]|uniref:Heat-inducible transcription repressor HrcA n=2 Tax=Corynebacteriaceae TaxID=1653 RepID=A0A2Z3YQP1_9CORY|nr:Heat-inducible transcription repressor HrcA [Corynebacterium provencense]